MAFPSFFYAPILRHQVSEKTDLHPFFRRVCCMRRLFRGVTEGEWGIVKCREIAGVRGAGE